jgi:CHAT domain-containing protein
MKYIIILSFLFFSIINSLAQSALMLLQEADTLFEYGAYANSMLQYDRASIEFKAGDKNNYLYCRNKSAECLIRIGKLDDAEEIVNLELEEIDSSLPQYRAMLYNSKATIYMYKGRLDQAITEAKMGIATLELNSRNSSNNTLTQSELYNTLGLIYWLQGNLEYAKDYLTQALEFRQSLTPKKPAAVAAVQNNLGLVYTGTDNDLALKSFQSAYDEYMKIYPKNHPSIAVVLSNIALIYRLQGVYNTSIAYYDSAYDIWEVLYPGNHTNKAFILSSKAQVYLEEKNFKTAHDNTDKALQMYQSLLDEKNVNIAATHILKGEIFKAQMNYTAALSEFQKSLISNSEKFHSTDPTMNPSSKDYKDGSLMLSGLLNKAHTLTLLHQSKTLRMKDLQQSLETYYVADSILSTLRHTRTGKSDKISLAKLASVLNERAVAVAYLISQNSTQPKKYLNDCFYFIEKSKSAVLLEAIADANAKSFSGIPDELLQEEENYQLQITYLEQKLIKGDAGDDEKKELTKRLFELKNKYDAFITQLEKQYPDYFNLKYNTQTTTIASIQSKLKKGDVMINYLIVEEANTLYRFCITPNDYFLTTASTPEKIHKTIAGFNNSIKFKLNHLFIPTATELSKYCIPKLPKGTEHLIIVADGFLSTIPFEALLSTTPKSDTVSFESLDYLVKHYSISYAFAGGLYQNYSYQGSGDHVLIFAPITFESVQMSDLPGSHQEAMELKSLYSDKNVTLLENDEASKTIFFSDSIKKFNIIQLATHGVVDPDQPELSCIYTFGKTAEEATLYTGDLYNINLEDVRLITLSACQTGQGKITKGEGLIGLSRALLYAGADQIIVSYWKVSDEATAKLMLYLHQNIHQNNMEFHEALQAAKKKLISESKFSAPYYWAPFVLIGE